ncbi:MAG: TIGR04086 family membrane protein [Clostridia bacterium]|nr:TIGR04086 family membrane protein [Clostridia bacterium]
MPSVRFIKNESNDKSFSVKPVIAGGISGVVIAILLLLGFAFLLLTLKISTDYIPVFAKSALILGAFFAGIISAKGRSTSGWLYGSLAGLLYFLILLVLGLVFKANTGFGLSKIVSLLFCIISGAIGGILGINMKSKAKKRKKH